MIGRNHVLAAVGSLGLADMTLHGFASAANFVKIGSVTANNMLNWYHSAYSVNPVYGMVCCAFFLLGTLLPDIDTEYSTISKILHMRAPRGERFHRTWTHSVWPLVLFGMFAAWFRPAWWLTVGYFLHLFWDSLSAMGICWFYPFQRYKRYSSGARVAKGHKLKFYHTGSVVETIITLLVFLSGLLWFLYGHVSKW